MFKIKVKLQLPDGNVKELNISDVKNYEVDESGILAVIVKPTNQKSWGYGKQLDSIEIQGEIIAVEKVMRSFENKGGKDNEK